MLCLPIAKWARGYASVSRPAPVNALSTFDRYTEAYTMSTLTLDDAEPGVVAPIREVFNCPECGANHLYCVLCQSAVCAHTFRYVMAMMA